MYAREQRYRNSGWQIAATGRSSGGGPVTADSVTPASAAAPRKRSHCVFGHARASESGATWVWFNATFAPTQRIPVWRITERRRSRLAAQRCGNGMVPGIAGSAAPSRTVNARSHRPHSRRGGNTLTLNLALIFKVATPARRTSTCMRMGAAVRSAAGRPSARGRCPGNEDLSLQQLDMTPRHVRRRASERSVAPALPP